MLASEIAEKSESGANYTVRPKTALLKGIFSSEISMLNLKKIPSAPLLALTVSPF
jgi:hypothetical protein